MSVIDKAVEWLINLANDDSHGYSQVNRWGPADYDCSSSTIRAFEQAGLQVRTNGASYTGNMRVAFEKCGFKSIKFNRSMVLKKGDVLLNEKHHVVVYIGDNKVVTASIDEVGTTVGKKPGDQTGKEIYIRSMYVPSYGWDYVLRYEGDSNTNPYPMPTRTIAKGMSGDDCRWVQYELNEAGANLQIDGQIGPKSDEAIRAFQKVVGIQTDGRVGKITRQKLIDITNKVLDILVPVTNPYPIPTRVLKLNCKGDDVKFVQFALNRKINAGLSVDGSYGKLTANAVYNFQKSVFPTNPKEWDKIVGNKTLEKLKA